MNQMAVHNLFKRAGEIKHPLKRIIELLEQIRERQDQQMVNEQEVKDAITTLQNDVATKLGEITSEVQTIETQVASGQPADLSGLKALVDETDSTVKNFALPTTPAAPASGGAGGAAPTTAGASDQPGGAAAPGA